VLVVEDSKVTLKVLCNFLERMGIKQPLTAETGTAAIEMYRKERPDIILLDAQLPDIDGFQIAEQIRESEHKDDWTAIIFLTSMTKDEDLARGIKAGGDDYLLKPVSEVVLQAKVRAMQRLVEMQRSLVDVTHQLNAANKELQRLSTTDGLTGIPNRRMFDELSVREWRRCVRAKNPSRWSCWISIISNCSTINTGIRPVTIACARWPVRWRAQPRVHPIWRRDTAARNLCWCWARRMPTERAGWRRMYVSMWPN
jgi:PleD family two-component response regulator